MADSLDELLRRIRAGEEAAAFEFVNAYEPFIRREVRLRLRDRRLQRIFDSMDICQSVMASFFVRVTAGAFEISSTDDLVRLLAVIAQRKLASAARSQRRQRRSVLRNTGTPSDCLAVIDPQPTPSRGATYRELAQKVQMSLSAEEKTIVEYRRDGLEWAEIARRVGGTPQGRRMQLTRAIDRVTEELGLDADD